MKKLDLIIWTCAFLIGWYYLTELSTAYYRAVSAYLDVRNSQAIAILYEGRAGK